MTVPAILLNSLAFVGLIATTYLIQQLITNLSHYTKHRTFPSSIEEDKIELLKSEIETLRRTIVSLEEENNEITKAVIKRLQ